MEPLKLRRVAIDTYKENVVFLHRDCELYRSEGFQALNKIEIRAEDAVSAKNKAPVQGAFLMGERKD